MRGTSRIARDTRSVQSEERKHTLQPYNSKQPDCVSSAVGDMFLDRESCWLVIRSIARNGRGRILAVFRARADDGGDSTLHSYHEKTESRNICRKDACVAPYSVKGQASVLVVEEQRAVYAQEVSEGACM